MGVLWFFVLFCCFFVTIGPILATTATICNVPGCNCTVKAASWKIVNCSLNGEQDLVMRSHFIPEKVTEININGGRSVVFDTESVILLPALGLVRIEDNKKIVMETQSFSLLTYASLLIQIQNCDLVNVKTGAFQDVQSTATVEITKCRSVAIAKSAFKRVISASFQDIGTMAVATGTFEFQGIVGHHGPVTALYFKNVTIPKIPPKSFASPLAEITIRDSVISQVEKDAFTAPQISSVTIINSQIKRIKNGALGPVVIYSFRINNCTINTLESKAIMAGIGNLTVEHSRITDIQSGAINTTVAKVEIVGNEINNFHTAGFVFQNWNRIEVEQNIINVLHPSFLVAPVNPEAIEFSFKENDLYNLHSRALSFVPEIDNDVLVMKNNFFNQTCHCELDEWIEDLIGANSTRKISRIMNATFCSINRLLSQCFELEIGLMNMENFTELVCNTNNTIYCEPYKGETKILNTTSKIFANNQPKQNSWAVVIISCAVLMLVIVIVVSIIVFIRGSRWLQRKGYFKKIQNNQNEASNDEENTVETVDESDKFDFPEDLTLELLQDLSKKLDDPNTHHEASEMIEQLYQKYIRNSGADNNNQQDEEAHLYEELGNLQQPGPQQSDNQGARSILKLMEEKFNTQFEDIDADENGRSALVGEYSEPSDAAVHLYSELESKDDNKDSLRSGASSSTMAFRPLPDKPGSSKMYD